MIRMVISLINAGYDLICIHLVTLIKRSTLEDKLLYILDRIKNHKIKNMELNQKLNESNQKENAKKPGL